MVAFMLESPAGAAPDPDGEDSDDDDAEPAGADTALELDAEDAPAGEDAGPAEDDDAIDCDGALDAAGVALDPHAARARPPTNVTAASWMDFFTSTSMLSDTEYLRGARSKCD